MEALVEEVKRQANKDIQGISAGRNTIILRKEKVSPAERLAAAVKRLFDIVFSAVGILLVMPLAIPFVYVLLRFSSPGPLFFIQERVGRNGRIFRCLKFRTMHVNSDSDVRQCGDDDERIFRVGRFLRTTHVDELPQLLNVFIGDMSLVGPRPHMVYHDELFSALLPEYSLRHHVRPGLTGLAQARGFHGPTPDLDSIRKRTRFDLLYIRNMSVKLDFIILMQTVRQIALPGKIED